MAVEIIAELSCNHGGDFRRACDLVLTAAKAGCTAVKLQCFEAEEMATPGPLLTGLWAGRDKLDLYREAETPQEWFRPLFDLAHLNGLTAFSSIVSPRGVDDLEAMGVPAYKVSSFELTDTHLLRYLSATGKPVYLSTGMASDPEIREALDALYPCDVTLLHCVSAYPCPLGAANIPNIGRLRQDFGRRVGLSWHNVSPVGPVAAVLEGAVAVEVHVRDDGPDTLDAPFSYRPAELAQLVRLIREAEQLGSESPALWEGPQKLLRRPAGGLRGQ